MKPACDDEDCKGKGKVCQADAGSPLSFILIQALPMTLPI